MGFDAALIRQAWSKYPSEDNIMDLMLTLQETNSKMITESIPVSALPASLNEDEYMQKAIAESVALGPVMFDFSPLEQRLRGTGTRIGLKNLGNTCYFNSLMQIYFNNPRFVEEILAFEENPESAAKNKERTKTSVQMVKELQKLFLLLVGSDLTYLDPSGVIANLVNDLGAPLDLSSQSDIGEFNVLFFARVKEALITQKKYASKMEVELSESKVDETVHLCSDYLGRISNALIHSGAIQEDRQESVSSIFINIKNTPDFYEAI